MLTIHSFAPSPLGEAAPLELPQSLALPQRRKRLRLYLLGSESDTQQTIDYLHVHGAIERIEWNPHAIAIPDNGLIIQPDPGDVLRYLQRERQFQ